MLSNPYLQNLCFYLLAVFALAFVDSAENYWLAVLSSSTLFAIQSAIFQLQPLINGTVKILRWVGPFQKFSRLMLKIKVYTTLLLLRDLVHSQLHLSMKQGKQNRSMYEHENFLIIHHLKQNITSCLLLNAFLHLTTSKREAMYCMLLNVAQLFILPSLQMQSAEVFGLIQRRHKCPQCYNQQQQVCWTQICSCTEIEDQKNIKLYK